MADTLVITDIIEEMRVLEVYAKSKLKAREWHGLADAAMDLRELEARLDAVIRISKMDQAPKLWDDN